MNPSTVLEVVEVPPHVMAPGFEVAGARHEHLGRPLDPFLAADAFAMAQPFFPPHPHAGFSAVTYMLPESPWLSRLTKPRAG
jgi:redox-sensitive bicupin YhaK (pirin superfamily)